MEINRDEYINVKDALNRIGGSMDLYKRLLEQFSGGDHIPPLEEALNNGDMEDASRLIHALKGVSANLSLIKLSVLAGDLEHKIKENLDCSDTLSELKNAYDVTIQQIPEIL